MHHGMVKDAVLKTRGMDNTRFRIADGKLTKSTIRHTRLANVLCELVEVGIKTLEKALNIRAVALGSGGLLSSSRQIVKSGDSFQGYRHTLHDVEASLVPFLPVPGA